MELFIQKIPYRQWLNKMTMSKALYLPDYSSELYYHLQSNSLYEIIKKFENSAVVKRYSAHISNTFSVITKPYIDSCYISWHLKFDNLITKQESIELAKELNENIASFVSAREFQETTKEIAKACEKNLDRNHLNSERVINDVSSYYSFDEIVGAVAIYIVKNINDSRISRKNREWAKNYISENIYDSDKLLASCTPNIDCYYADTLANKIQRIQNEHRKTEKKNPVDLTKEPQRRNKPK